jgi:poly-beta-hydroxyalkanoate depolymerase
MLSQGELLSVIDVAPSEDRLSICAPAAPRAASTTVRIAGRISKMMVRRMILMGSPVLTNLESPISLP